jgi:hypothetical protein
LRVATTRTEFWAAAADSTELLYQLLQVGCCCEIAWWLLKKSFQGISTTKFVCKLLNIRSL